MSSIADDLMVLGLSRREALLLAHLQKVRKSTIIDASNAIPLKYDNLRQAAISLSTMGFVEMGPSNEPNELKAKRRTAIALVGEFEEAVHRLAADARRERGQIEEIERRLCATKAASL